uniref:Macro domain-containing protein n=1 Tax=Clastoptera arizonana TaxID=38151 RepID=A0A1B6C5J9_9HEMI
MDSHYNLQKSKNYSIRPQRFQGSNLRQQFWPVVNNNYDEGFVRRLSPVMPQVEYSSCPVTPHDFRSPSCGSPIPQLPMAMAAGMYQPPQMAIVESQPGPFILEQTGRPSPGYPHHLDYTCSNCKQVNSFWKIILEDKTNIIAHKEIEVSQLRNENNRLKMQLHQYMFEQSEQISQSVEHLLPNNRQNLERRVLNSRLSVNAPEFTIRNNNNNVPVVSANGNSDDDVRSQTEDCNFPSDENNSDCMNYLGESTEDKLENTNNRIKNICLPNKVTLVETVESDSKKEQLEIIKDNPPKTESKIFTSENSPVIMNPKQNKKNTFLKKNKKRIYRDNNLQNQAHSEVQILSRQNSDEGPLKKQSSLATRTSSDTVSIPTSLNVEIKHEKHKKGNLNKNENALSRSQSCSSEELIKDNVINHNRQKECSTLGYQRGSGELEQNIKTTDVGCKNVSNHGSVRGPSILQRNNETKGATRNAVISDNRRGDTAPFQISPNTMDQKTKTREVIRELSGDLFSVPAYYSLAHCVGSDFRMSSGIAVTFKQMFKNVGGLLSQNSKVGDVAFLEDNGRFIFYLVTKKLSSGKPTYDSFENAVQSLAAQCSSLNVKYLAMPKIGCGLDKLEWRQVKRIINNAFCKMDVEILVYNFEENFLDREMKKSGPLGPTLKEANKKLVEIESETALVFLGTEDGHMNKTAEDLNKKFHFFNKYRNETKVVGDVLRLEHKEIIFSLIVRKKADEPLNFQIFENCLKKLNKHLNTDKFEYVGFEAFDDPSDDMIMCKIISLFRSTLKNKIELWICWPPGVVNLEKDYKTKKLQN